MGFENLNSQKNEAGGAQAEDRRRTEKRLARGLEDVSYLFLSQTADEPVATGEERGGSSQQALPDAAEPKIPAVLHSSPAVSRDQLVSLLHRNTAVLEEGMHVMDANIPCDPCGPIDLLATDGLNQLAIVDVDTVSNEQLLLRGICHFDWFIRNIAIVRRMYHGRVINFSSQPRLFLVAPDFSPLLKCAAQRISCPQIHCFGYRTLTTSSGSGILFERV
jgi:hypothetical protein